MRGVAGAFDQAGFDGCGDVRPHDAELFVGSVGVVGALQAEGRDADRWQEIGYVEVTETRVEPGAVPAVEGDVGVAVIAGEARAEVAGFVGVLDLADAGDVEVFDEEMGGDGDQGVEVGRRASVPSPVPSVVVGEGRPSTPFPIPAPQAVDGRPSPTTTEGT